MLSNEKSNLLKTFLTILNSVYPWMLFILAAFPSMYGAFISPDEIPYRDLYVLLYWIPVFTIPNLFFKRNFLYYFLSICIFTLGAIDIGFWNITDMPVNETNLHIFFNTNLTEAIGFASLNLSKGFLVYIPYLFILIFALRHPPKYKIKQFSRLESIITLSILSISLLFFVRKTFQETFISYGTPNSVRSVYTFYNDNKAYHNLTSEERLNSQKGNSKSIISEDEVIVLILGESTSRNHMGLYNPALNTTPLLNKRNDLFVFQDVISGYPNTLESITNSLTNANVQNGMNPSVSVTLAEVFRGADYKTYWLSNQYPLGIWNNLVSIFAQQYEETVFLKLIDSIKTGYDEELFSPLVKALHEKATKKLIVLHLDGAHQTYNLKYPAAFNINKKHATPEEKIRNEYHNAILYNDFVVDSLINLVKEYCDKNQTIGSIVYAPDHGESIYDCENKFLGHSYVSLRTPKCMVEIPYITWLSSSYKKAFPNRVKSIEDNLNKPYMTDDLFHSLIDLGNIKNSHLDLTRSIYHKSFIPKERIFTDGANYDK